MYKNILRISLVYLWKIKSNWSSFDFSGFDFY